MKGLGFVSAVLPDAGLEAVPEIASALGYAYVELMCWPHGPAQRRYAGVSHVDVVRIRAGEKERVEDLLARFPVEIASLGYYPNPLAPDAEESDNAIHHLKQVIAAAQVLGVPVVNTFVGRDSARSVDANWSRFTAVWTDLVRYAEDHGVKLAIENCPMLYTGDEWPGGNNLAASPAIWRRMFDAIPSSSFGLNYDPSHLLWQHIDPVRPLSEFAGRLFHVHAKDARILRQKLNDVGILATPLEYHQPCLPGHGDMDWAKFFAELSRIQYSGPVCVEVEDRDYESTREDRIRALRESFEYLRKYWPA
jgi:sugar phosphate isomerase/epimerase